MAFVEKQRFHKYDPELKNKVNNGLAVIYLFPKHLKPSLRLAKS